MLFTLFGFNLIRYTYCSIIGLLYSIRETIGSLVILHRQGTNPSHVVLSPIKRRLSTSEAQVFITNCHCEMIARYSLRQHQHVTFLMILFSNKYCAASCRALLALLSRLNAIHVVYFNRL